MPISKREIKPVSVVRGVLLSVGMRWTDRLIGFVSTLILARLLLPEDFGIVAMASIIVGLIATLLDLGVGSALIQNKHAAREEYDTAWTLRLMQAASVALFIWLLAPFAAEYFRDPRVYDVIRVMALTMLIGGFENIGIVAFQKNMEFGRDFQFFFFRRIPAFIVTLALAFWMHSYWAMVLGTVVGRTVTVGASYWFHDYRPRFSCVRLKQIWSFSQWVLVRNLGGYAQAELDKFLVGRRTDAATMGSYALADEIAAMPGNELLAPVGRVLFPAFVSVADDPEKLRAMFCKAFGVQTLLAMPAAVGLVMVAGDAVPVLLGERWLSVIPLVQTLALIGVFSALTHSGSYVLLALGKVKLQALIFWLLLGVLVFLAMIIFPDAGAQGLAYIRLATSATGLLLFVALVSYHVETLRLSDFVKHAWRPVISTGIMAIFLSALPRFEFMSLTFHLFLSIILGIIIYSSAIIILWRAFGAQDGAETYLFEQMRMKGKVFKWLRV
jgi:lipopolysaccharide exporter